MKTLTFIIAILFSVQLVFSNDGKYVETMQKSIQSVYTAQNIPELQNVVNTFERIASAEKTKWEPFYYASFGYIMMSNQGVDNAKKDAYLDLADAAIKKAKAIDANESEIVALEGFIQMLRINIDPASRGQQYSGMAMQSFGTALHMNGENPRALALMAQMQFGTAQFFKSSTAEACGMASKAKEKFNTYHSSNPLAPQWGRDMNEGLLSQCK